MQHAGAILQAMGETNRRLRMLDERQDRAEVRAKRSRWLLFAVIVFFGALYWLMGG